MSFHKLTWAPWLKPNLSLSESLSFSDNWLQQAPKQANADLCVLWVIIDYLKPQGTLNRQRTLSCVQDRPGRRCVDEAEVKESCSFDLTNVRWKSSPTKIWHWPTLVPVIIMDRPSMCHDVQNFVSFHSPPSRNIYLHSRDHIVS